MEISSAHRVLRVASQYFMEYRDADFPLISKSTMLQIYTYICILYSILVGPIYRI